MLQVWSVNHSIVSRCEHAKLSMFCGPTVRAAFFFSCGRVLNLNSPVCFARHVPAPLDSWGAPAAHWSVKKKQPRFFFFLFFVTSHRFNAHVQAKKTKQNKHRPPFHKHLVFSPSVRPCRWRPARRGTAGWSGTRWCVLAWRRPRWSPWEPAPCP